MNTALTLTCATCNGPISNEDLAQGLAVRVDGQTICPMCVDLLPGRAQFEINKLRALKGFNATTYRVMVPDHQDHQRFTFTTAGNVMGHYRTLHSDGEFVAPLLPESARHVRSVLPRPSAGHGAAVLAAPQPPAAVVVAEVATRPWLIYAVFACAVLLCGLITVACWQQHTRSQTRSRAEAALGAVQARKLRSDYPSDPLEAWEMGSTDRHCPPEVLSQIDLQLRQQLTTDLDQAQGDIGQRAFSAAEADLGAVHVPDEPAFGALRQRARELTALLSTSRQPPTPVVDPATAVHDAPAETPAQAPVQTPLPVPVVVEAAKAPAVPATPPGECWLMGASELLPAGSSDWTQEGLLRGSSGNLQRTLPPMRGGSYQVWVHAAARSARPGSLILLIDNQVVDTLYARQADGYLWHALTSQMHLGPGSHQLQIEAAGSGWRVSQIYLASLDHGPPDAGTTPAAVPWPQVAPPDAAAMAPVQPAAVVPVEEQRFVQEWKASYTWPKNLQNELMDGSSNLPSPWPCGGPPFVRAQSFTSQGNGTLVLRLAKQDVIGGGMVLLLHPMRVDRKSLAVRVEWTPDPADAGGEKQPNFINLDPLTFSSEAWQVFPIAFPELARQPSQLRLRLSDTEDFGPDLRGFLLGSAVTVAHGAPAVQDLHLLSSPLLSSDVITDSDYQRKLISIMGQVVAHRKGAHLWNESRYFNPLQCRFLVAKGSQDWMAAMRARLAQIDNARTPHGGLFAALEANPQWMTDLDPEYMPMVDATDVSLAVVLLNGQEGLNRLRDPAHLLSWVRKLCTGLVEGVQGKGGGVLPVFVIGATTTAVAGQQQSIDKAWSQVMEFCFENGIPLLDIRNAQFAEGDTPEQLSVRLLGDGLQALFYQLRWLQRNVKP